MRNLRANLVSLGVVLGALAGFAYWSWVAYLAGWHVFVALFLTAAAFGSRCKPGARPPDDL